MVQKIMPQTYHTELQPDAMRGSEQFLNGVDYIDLEDEQLAPVGMSKHPERDEDYNRKSGASFKDKERDEDTYKKPSTTTSTTTSSQTKPSSST